MSEVKPASPAAEFEVGDQVRHPQFGIGTILYKSGVGESAKVDVAFAEEGQKKLLLKYAKLKKVTYPSAPEGGEAQAGEGA